MTGTVQPGLGYIALVIVLAGFLVRWALTGGTPNRHRGPRAPRRIEVEVRGRDLIPALTGRAYGAAAPQAVAHCPPCGRPVPVVIHGTAHRCEKGHVTITGGTF